jgi:molybdate-binding protein/DNA-binding XRE family transcriptional regulator
MGKGPDTITCNLKAFRLAKGWSQEDLAARLGIRRQAVYDIESGRYLPNTAVALRLASLFGCRVEDLFVDRSLPEAHPLDLVHDTPGVSGRLALGRVRNRLVGIPLSGAEAMSEGLRSASGLAQEGGSRALFLAPPERIDRAVILMGCDPAFHLLGELVSRHSPDVAVLCRFASSHRALDGLARGLAHIAGTHLHNTGPGEANVEAARLRLGGAPARVIGFSLMEEGLMVAPGNPLAIRSVADLARPGVRFVNREPGAALRALADDLRTGAGIEASAIQGFDHTVSSHREGAWRILCGVADAALGLRAVAEAYDLGFVPLAEARCDLVVPGDLLDHPGIRILLDVLSSSGFRRELAAVPGYGSSVAGTVIAAIQPGNDP